MSEPLLPDDALAGSPFPRTALKETAMDPIAELKTEHRTVLKSVAILESRVEKAQGDEAAFACLMPEAERLLEFFEVFVDACHPGREESFLFPALQALGVSRQGGPIGVMLDEHEEGRRLVASMREALARIPAGGAEERFRFTAAARQYALLLRRHIEKEEYALFRIASERLDETAKEHLARGFERIEAEKVGPYRI